MHSRLGYPLLMAVEVSTANMVFKFSLYRVNVGSQVALLWFQGSAGGGGGGGGGGAPTCRGVDVGLCI